MLHVFSSPARYVQGREATQALPDELIRLGLSEKAMIVASPSARRLLESVWRETVAARGLAHEVFEFGGEGSPADGAEAEELLVGARGRGGG